MVTPRKGTEDVCSRTVRARTKQVEEDLVYAAGSLGPGADLIFAQMLKRKTRLQLQQILQEHGLLKIQIPLGEELALKARLGWSWAEMRKLKT